MITVRELFRMLGREIVDGAGDEPVYVVTHGKSSPFEYIEPGDGLEGLYLIGDEEAR